MVDRATKLRWRRIFRRRKKQVVEISSTTEQSIEKHIIKRLIRLPNVRRFLVGWVGLLIVLAVGLVFQTRALGTKYQSVQPKSGGSYTEGIIGSFTNANPLFASNSVDSSVSRLVFSGLLKHDDQNRLVGDLAESWSVDTRELVYTVKLKPNIKWHDGQPVTANDVAYTYRMIQSPEAKSYLYPSWQNIKVTAVDPTTVTFTLPNSLSSFPYSLTNGIIPEHVLGKVPAAQLRSDSFNNQAPIGSGPFKFSKVEVINPTPDVRQESVALSAFDSYAFGKPKIDNFIIRTYPNESGLTDAFTSSEVDSMVGLASLPDQFAKDSSILEYNVPLTGQVFVFFRTTQDVLKDPAVRTALVLGTDKKVMFDKLPYPLVSIDEPLLKSHIGYDKKYAQKTGDPDAAKKVLDAAGWAVNPTTNIREKNGVKLTFKMYSQMTSEYSSVAGTLQQQWQNLGVDMKVDLQNDQDLQSTLALHNYDALLYGISVGPDPDVFAFWHSSQADARSSTRLNFSEYVSIPANQALESGRTRSDPQLRSVKYRPFLEAWQKDAPALALYQPRMLYITHKPFNGLDSHSATTATDRFTNVQNWTIREGLAVK